MDKDKVIQKLDEIINEIKKLVELREAPQYFEIIAAKSGQKAKIKYLESELSELKSAKEEMKSAEILSADEMLTNHFLDDNWEPNYQNIVKIMDKFHSQFQSIQPWGESLNTDKRVITTTDNPDQFQKFSLLEERETITSSDTIHDQSVQSKEEKPQFNYFQLRDLTDAEWLAMPKEEILQLYKNCYKLLMENFKSQPVQSVKGEGERAADDFLTKQGYTKTVKYPDGRIVEPSFQRETVCQLLESYKHSESKDMYPKEFIEFLCDYYQKFWDRYILLNGEHVDPFNTKQPFFTFEEVFNHWSTVVTKR